MNTLIRLITLRQLTLQPLRSALMIMGIALGVSVFVGVRALNETTLKGFEAVFSVASQEADLIVEGSRNGLDQSLVQKLSKNPSVKSAAPILVNYARPTNTPDSKKKKLSSRRYLILGLDLLSKSTGQVYGLDKEDSKTVQIPNPLVFAMNPQAILVSQSFSQRESLKAGQKLSFFTSAGQRQFVIAGTYQENQLSKGLGGDVMIMNLKSAQIMFSRQGKVDRIALRLKDNYPPKQTKKSLEEYLGPAVNVSIPGQNNERATKMLGSMQVGLTMASLLALLIGQFLIYNTMTTAIIRRRPEIGILRAIGSTRKQLALLWFAEALAYGFLGAILGVGAGLGVAQLSLGFFSENISNLYEAIDLRSLHFSYSTIVLGILSGPFATALAAILPIREALRISPVDAARVDRPPQNPQQAVTRLLFTGMALLALTMLTNALIESAGLYLGAALQLGLTLGFALCAPWGIVKLTVFARPFIGGILGPSGYLAGDNIVKSPIRSGITVAALMVAVGGVLSISALVFSLKSTISTWLDNVLTGDYYISASSPLGGQNGTLIDRGFQREILKYPEVDTSIPMRFTFENVDNKPALLIVMPGNDFGRRAKVPIVAGDLDQARKTLISGESVVVSQNFARIRQKKLGDIISVSTANGSREFTISLICVDYSSEHGTLFFDRSVYDQEFKDTRVNTFNVFLKKSTPPQRRKAIAEELRNEFGAKYDLFVLENSAFRGSILKTVEDSFMVTYAMELVAICIALLGIVNTLFAAVLERTREIGVLRALGANRRHIRLAVVSEAFLIGALAGGFGVVAGYVLGYVMVTTITSGAFGWLLPFHWPWTASLLCAFGAAFLSGISGLIPAERAATLDIVEALSYE